MEFELKSLTSDTALAVLRGRGDADGISLIDAAFCKCVEAYASSVVVDMGPVGFIGSLGIRMLIACAREVSRRGGKLALFGVSGSVMESLETVHLPELIPIAPDLQSAQALVRQ